MKNVSWTCRSIGGEAMITPVNPPNRNVARNPNDHSMGVSKVSFPRHMVPIQLKNFTPVGTAISIDMMAKNGSNTAPVANMWWAHTVTERARSEEHTSELQSR